MSVQIFLTLLLFAFASSITPGPNNFMLLTSGVRFGFRRTIPHMLGICGGFTSLLMGIGLGLGALLKTAPILHTGLKLGGGAYLLYLSWKIATAPAKPINSQATHQPDAEANKATDGDTSAPTTAADNIEALQGTGPQQQQQQRARGAHTARKLTVLEDRPMSFWEAFGFQWINVKAWVMAVNAMANYTSPNNYALTVLLVAVAFAMINLPCVSSWAVFGTLLRQWLANPIRLRCFNITMGLLLAASLWPMLR